MTGQPKEPRQKERNQVTVNLAGLFVGVVLFVSVVWALVVNQMTFAYLCAILLTVLAISNHVVNMVYQ